MATYEQLKVINLLAKSKESGVAVINENNNVSPYNKAFDISLLSTSQIEKTNATVVIEPSGKITFYSMQSTSDVFLKKEQMTAKPLEHETSAALCKVLQLPVRLLELENKPVSIRMLNKFFITANTAQISHEEKPDVKPEYTSATPKNK